jgi:thiol-disulfide isomerase/thioredoxin
MKLILSISTIIIFLTGFASRSAAQAMVPPFAVVCFDDSSKLISSESLKGKLTLIDFWASWCPPCVEELPELERVYKAYKDSGFTVLSFSFDKSAEQLKKFRNKRFAMPWIHAWIEDGFGSHIAHLFDVQNIPHQLLVDARGVIVAADEELRGAQLELTLRKYLHQ